VKEIQQRIQYNRRAGRQIATILLRRILNNHSTRSPTLLIGNESRLNGSLR